jgi:hypothetical protein
VLFAAEPVFAFFLLKFLANESILQRLSCEWGTACMKLLGYTVDSIDKIVVEGHLDRSHIAPLQYGFL